MMPSVPNSGKPNRPFALLSIGATGVLAGALLGALTNAINGSVSPQYFVTVMRWGAVLDVWRASIAQGVFEGILFGVLFSLIFTTGVGIISNATCRYGFALRHLLGIVAGALLCWVLGGLIAMGLATLSPEFYRRAFYGVPEEFDGMLRYAWVGGTIWGVQIGGLVSVVLGLVFFRNNWRSQLNRVSTIARPQ